MDFVFLQNCFNKTSQYKKCGELKIYQKQAVISSVADKEYGIEKFHCGGKSGHNVNKVETKYYQLKRQYSKWNILMMLGV